MDSGEDKIENLPRAGYGKRRYTDKGETAWQLLNRLLGVGSMLPGLSEETGTRETDGFQRRRPDPHIQICF